MEFELPSENYRNLNTEQKEIVDQVTGIYCGLIKHFCHHTPGAGPVRLDKPSFERISHRLHDSLSLLVSLWPGSAHQLKSFIDQSTFEDNSVGRKGVQGDIARHKDAIKELNLLLDQLWETAIERVSDAQVAYESARSYSKRSSRTQDKSHARLGPSVGVSRNK